MNTLGCLYLLMNFVFSDLFIAENFDVVRYSVFKERSPLSADIKPFQLPEQVLYSVQLFFFSTEWAQGGHYLLGRYLVGSSGLEPPTSRLSGVRSNRLSYKPAWLYTP